MLSLWEMGASYSEAIFSKMPRQSYLKKKLNVKFGSSFSHGYASLPPESFEMLTIKFEMKNYRNVKPMAFGSIYFFLNSSSPKQSSRIWSYLPIL